MYYVAFDKSQILGHKSICMKSLNKIQQNTVQSIPCTNAHNTFVYTRYVVKTVCAKCLWFEKSCPFYRQLRDVTFDHVIVYFVWLLFIFTKINIGALSIAVDVNPWRTKG